MLLTMLITQIFREDRPSVGTSKSSKTSETMLPSLCLPFEFEHRAGSEDGQYRWFLDPYNPSGITGQVYRWYSTGTVTF